MPQHLRPANHPAKCPTSQSPHPTAVLSGTASPWDPLRRVRQGVSIQSLSTILNAQNVYTSESRKRTSREVSESLPLSETGDITKAPSTVQEFEEDNVGNLWSLKVSLNNT